MASPRMKLKEVGKSPRVWMILSKYGWSSGGASIELPPLLPREAPDHLLPVRKEQHCTLCTAGGWVGAECDN